MTAYVVVDAEVTDPVAYEAYKRLAEVSLPPYGGRYLVRGGAMEVLEGDWAPQRVVVLAFPDAEAARRWRAGPEYQAAVEARKGAATLKAVLVVGLDVEQPTS